jgi:hypothetical protein
MDFSACEYQVRIPGIKDNDVIRATPLDRVRDLTLRIFAKHEFLKEHFNLVNFQTLESNGPFLCITPNASRDGMVLSATSYLKDCINPAADILALYEYPHVIAVVCWNADWGFFFFPLVNLFYNATRCNFFSSDC